MRRRLTGALAVLAALTMAAPALRAQNLGPFRQFLAVEPYYSWQRLDVGDGASAPNLHGVGARLWLNTAPFGVTDKLGVGLFTSYTPNQGDHGITVLQYGAQLELFPMHRPLGGIIDPFVTAGAAAYRLNTFGGELGVARGPVTRLAVMPGAGIRIPIPNRLQLRVDVRDAIVFGNDLQGAGGERRTTNNLEIAAALGLTF